jgi:hypothetical protein
VRRQQGAAFIQPRSVDIRSSALSVGQPVRALIKNKWLPGVVSVVCPEPNSYVVRLNDGRLFRRTRWAINILVCDSTLNPVRPCDHRPTILGFPTATVPSGNSVIGHPTLAPSSVSRQIPLRQMLIHPVYAPGLANHWWRKVNKLLLCPLCRCHAFLWLLRALLHVLVRACRLSVLLAI